MFVNSVSRGQIRNSYWSSQAKNSNNYLVNENNSKINNFSFTGGPNPEILRNQLKIFLTQDIWDVKLKVKKPETPIEKDVILEILQNRLKLDRFTRLSNEKAALKFQISLVNDLLEKDPSNPKLATLLTELNKKGNLESILKRLDKDIDIEAKKHKPALEYFKQIDNLEEEYINKKLITPSKMEKFWFKIQKNNINNDKQYSTADLIKIISGEQQEIVQEASKPLTKKQLIAKISQQYEDLFRKNINIYSENTNHYYDVINIPKIIAEQNKEDIARFPGIEKIFPKIFESIKSKHMHKVERLREIDIYPIGKLWTQMDSLQTDMQKLIKDIAETKKLIEIHPESKEYAEMLKSKENILLEAKQEWLNGVKYSVQYENINRQRMIAQNRVEEYDYLVGENKTIKKHKAILQLLNENNGIIPDDIWIKIVNEN